MTLGHNSIPQAASKQLPTTEVSKKENKYARQFTRRMRDKLFSAAHVRGDDEIIIDFSQVTFDAYDVLNAFYSKPEDKLPCQTQVDHALKKLLALGKRSGGKTIEQDINEAIWSLQEALKELPHDN